MTGYRSSALRHKCPGDGCYIEQLPDWEEIIACFPRKIRPTDIDGLVEINAHLLFLEEKRSGVAPDNGQRLALKALSRKPNTTVLIFRPGGSLDLQTLIFRGGETSGWQDCTRTQFLHWIERWALSADDNSASRQDAAS